MAYDVATPLGGVALTPVPEANPFSEVAGTVPVADAKLALLGIV